MNTLGTNKGVVWTSLFDCDLTTIHGNDLSVGKPDKSMQNGVYHDLSKGEVLMIRILFICYGNILKELIGINCVTCIILRKNKLSPFHTNQKSNKTPPHHTKIL